MADNYRDNPYEEEERKFCPYSHAVTTIDELHRLTHDGMVYHTSGKILGVLDEGIEEFLLVTPALTFPHFQRLRITAGRGDIDLEAYEGATASADGTPLTPFNTNRNSTRTAATVVNTGPTITGDGTLIHTTWLPPTGTGVGQSANGLVGETNGEEWVLKPSTKYLIRLTNNSGATIDISYEILWYEIDYDL